MKTAIFSFLLLFSLSFANAKSLNGTYTINPSGSGYKNYTTFTKAVKSLTDSGISGAVVFNVSNGSYKEQITIGNITGVSAKNTITFQSAKGDSSKVILYTATAGTYTTPGFALHLQNASFIIFSKISIKNTAKFTSLSYNDYVVVIDEGSDSNTFQNCQLFGTYNSSYANYSPIVFAGGTLAGNYSIDNYNTFSNNLIRKGGYGIFSSGYYSASEIGNVIQGNIIDSTYYGISMTYNDSSRITNNKVHNPWGGYGFYLYYFGVNTTSYIMNNFISLGTSDGNPLAGIYGYSLDNCNIVNNSINIYGTSSPYYGSNGMNLYNSFYSNCNLENNIIINKNITSSDFALSYNYTYSEDHNILICKGPNCIYNNSTNYKSISSYQAATGFGYADTGINPYFVSDTNLHVGNASLGGKAVSLSFNKTDIDGQARSAKAPYVGADEYFPPSLLPAITDILNPTLGFCTNTQDVYVILSNQGSNTLTNATIEWKVNDTVQTAYSWKGSLSSGSTAKIKLGTYTFSTARKLNYITSYTSAGNGTSFTSVSRNTTTVYFRPGIIGGKYSIDKSGSGDYKTFRAAINDLKQSGLCGAVVYEVANGTYKESLFLDSFSGTSPTKTISFRSKSGDSSKVIIDTVFENNSGSVNAYTLLLNGAQYMSFEGLCFRNIIATTYYTGDVVEIFNGTHDIRFSHCLFRSNSGSTILNYGSVIKTDQYSPCNNITIENSRVSGGSNGLYYYNYSGTQSRGNVVKGDIIDSAQTYCMYIIGQDNFTLSGNVINNGNPYSGIDISNSGMYDTIYITNNFMTFDGCYYGLFITGGNLINIYNNSIYTNSVTDACYIQTSSSYGSQVNFKNNIVFCNDQGMPLSYYNYYSILTSDYNDLFTRGTVIGSFNYVNSYSLKDWTHTTGLDSHSVSINPRFINPVKQNLHLSQHSKYIAYSGLVIPEVSTDFDNEPRKSLYSIGADEFPTSKVDAEIFSIDNMSAYSCGTKTQQAWVSLMNPGSDTLKSVLVRWKVNGVSRPVYRWKGLLAPGQRTTVKLDTVGLLSGRSYYIIAATDSPNKVSDGNKNNDSAQVLCGTGMSGTYTIGGSNPDFSSFGNAAYILKTLGVCGATTFNVRDGSYNECVTIDSLHGSSPTNTVVFQSQSLDSTKVTLDTVNGNSNYYSPAYTLRFNGCSYVSFRDMSITNNLSAALSYMYGDVIFITNNAHHVKIENSRLISNVSATIANNGNIVDDDFTSDNSYLTIKNNLIKGASDGVLFSSNSKNGEIGNVVSGNNITGFTNAAIYMMAQDSMLVEKNNIFTTVPGYGIFISGNLNNSSGVDTSIVRNNFITAPNAYAGFYSSENDMLNVYNNSLYTANASSATYFINSSFGTTVSVFNNIFQNDSSGVAITYNDLGLSNCDNNNYFSRGKYFATFNTNNYDKIVDLHLSNGFDLKSVLGNPYFKTIKKGDLHLTGKSNIDVHSARGFATVPDDIDGQKRTIVPCIGADDLPLVGNDANLMSIDSPAAGFCSGVKTIYATIRNTGNTTISSVTINWGTDGIARTPVSWKGTLVSGARMQIKLDTVSFAIGKLIKIYAATHNPNGAQDSFAGNDSLGYLMGASMSGTFTIGGTSPDFKNIRSAVNVLNKAGVCGPVTFNIRDGKYHETVQIGRIIGASAINTVTFESQSLDSSKVTIDSTWSSGFSGSPNLINLNGASHVIFKKLTFTYSYSGSGGIIVQIDKGSNNVFTNNHVLGIANVTSAGMAILNGNNNQVLNNLIEKSSYGIELYNNGTTNVSLYGNIIRGNVMNSNDYGIYAYESDSTIIEYNRINNPTSYGIFLYHVAASFLKDTFIIANNFITSGQVGLYINATSTSVRNNNIFTNYGSPTVSFFSSVAKSKDDFINNITVNKGYAEAAYFYGDIYSDYNDYYTNGSDVITSGSFGSFSDLATWQFSSGLDSSSVSTDPKFNNTAKGDLHIKSSSGSGVARMGKYLPNYPYDFDHQRRPHMACDIGADQFTFENNDIGVTAILYPGLKKCEDSVNSVPVQISNLGLNTESGFRVYLSVNGPDTVTTSFKYTNTLRVAMDTLVLMQLPHKLNTKGSGNYHFTAYTSLVNDTDRSSDTFTANYNFRSGLIARPTFRSPSCAGDITFLYDSSKGSPNSSQWNFGDGFVSSKKNPLHAFNHPGKYTVSLKIRNSTGCTDSTSKIVSVDSADARYTYAFNGSKVNFTPKISGMKYYYWDYGDGSGYDTLQNASHMYSVKGKYRVILRVITQAGCVATYSDSVNALYTGVSEEANETFDFSVYPNPFSDVANITYSLDKATHMNVEVYDVWGRKLATLVNNEQASGAYSIPFNPLDYNIRTAGILILKINAGNYTTRKTLVMTH